MIKTERLFLMPLKKEWYEGIIENDHTIFEKVGLKIDHAWFAKIAFSQVNSMLSLLNMGYAEEHLLWLIVLEKSNLIIGDISIVQGDCDREGSLSYRMMKAHRHRGYASEAIRALTFYHFWCDTEGLECITADVLRENVSSKKCILSANYKQIDSFEEGIERFVFDRDDYNAFMRSLSINKEIITSGCLMGLPMRYDGSGGKLTFVIPTSYHLIPICPEQLGGLATPRDPVEYAPDRSQYMTQRGIDCTDAFFSGADAFVSFAKRQGTSLFLLKQNSPSCGSLAIYDGSFERVKVKGEGCTVKMIRKHFEQYVILDEDHNMCLNI